MDPFPALRAVVTVGHQVEGLGMGERDVGEESPPLVGGFPQHGSALRAGLRGEVARRGVGNGPRAGHPGWRGRPRGFLFSSGDGRDRG